MQHLKFISHGGNILALHSIPPQRQDLQHFLCKYSHQVKDTHWFVCWGWLYSLYFERKKIKCNLNFKLVSAVKKGAGQFLIMMDAGRRGCLGKEHQFKWRSSPGLASLFCPLQTSPWLWKWSLRCCWMCICRGSCWGSSGCWVRPRVSVAASESRGRLAGPAGSCKSSASAAGSASGGREDSAGRCAGSAGWASEGMGVGASGNSTAKEEEQAYNPISFCSPSRMKIFTFWLHLSIYIAHGF